MDVVRFGGDVRLLRKRRGWTQWRLASEARVSRWVIGEIEAGRGDRITAERLIRVVAALGGYLSIRIQYQGEGIDRLRDRRHAAARGSGPGGATARRDGDDARHGRSGTGTTDLSAETAAPHARPAT
jgi:transcriptional regulator with XRE-family HTH domain